MFVRHRHHLVHDLRFPNALGSQRFYGSGDLHFITGSCYHQQPFLGSAHRRDLFLSVLEQVRQRYSFVVVGYVVMPEHFHLLLSEPEKGDPSVVMQALKLGFARRVLTRSRRRGRLQAVCGRRRRSRTFGNAVSMTTMFGASTNVSRSCATFIVIRSGVALWRNPSSGAGAASVPMPTVKPDQSG